MPVSEPSRASMCGLIRIAELRREPRQVLIAVEIAWPGDEPPEAQHPVECLRPVADRLMESPAQLPPADPEGVGEFVDPAAGEAETARRREHKRIRRGLGEPGGHQPLEQQVLRPPVPGAVQSLGQPMARGPKTSSSGTRDVEELARRPAEPGPRHAGTQPDADDRSGLRGPGSAGPSGRARRRSLARLARRDRRTRRAGSASARRLRHRHLAGASDRRPRGAMPGSARTPGNRPCPQATGRPKRSRQATRRRIASEQIDGRSAPMEQRLSLITLGVSGPRSRAEVLRGARLEDRRRGRTTTSSSSRRAG